MVLGTVACFVFGLLVIGFVLFLPWLPTDKDTLSRYPEVAHYGNADTLTRLRLFLGIQDNIRSLGQEVKELPKGDIVLDAPSVMKGLRSASSRCTYWFQCTSRNYPSEEPHRRSADNWAS
jgi:hypothetical protein